MILDESVSFELCVQLRDIFEGFDGSFDEKRHEAEFDAVFLDKAILVADSKFSDFGEIDLVESCENRGFVLSGDETFADSLAKRREPFACCPLAGSFWSGGCRLRGAGGRLGGRRVRRRVLVFRR